MVTFKMFPGSIRRLPLLIILVVILSLSVTIHLAFYNDSNVLDTVQALSEKISNPNIFTGKGSHFSINQISSAPKGEKLIVYPKNFKIADEQVLIEHYIGMFADFPAQESNYSIFRFSKYGVRTDALSSTVKDLPYHMYSMKIFGSNANIDGKVEKCNVIESKIDIEVSERVVENRSLKKIVKRFMEKNSTYFQEINELFKIPMDEQIKKGTIHEHWYRLAGSSVWLEQYGVHFMVSRIVYAYNGNRATPNLSLLYAQAYDENWVEIEDIELIVPSNNPDVGRESDEEPYHRLQLPMILPIPNHLDKNKQNPGFLGAEDPRIMIVKNPRGFEEPLVFYNTYHGKVTNIDQLEETKANVEIHHNRNIHMAWPFQTQRGKYNVEDLPNKYYNNIYTRILEVKKAGEARIGVQKNWTPFISYYGREEHGYDKYLYMAIRYDHFQIVKCPLAGVTDPFISGCEVVYKLNPEQSEHAGVGPLRGGSQFINVNNLLKSYEDEIENAGSILEKIPKGREIWIGFARANVKDCGCGTRMYRPNLVVAVKEGEQYKLSHVTSFVDLDVKITGWDLNDPENGCPQGHATAMIPNGISSWTLRDSAYYNTTIDDYLTMSYSLSDDTVEIIHLRGILNALLKLDYKNRDYKVFDNSPLKNVGFNNDNLDCALEASKVYCKEYGESEDKKKEQRLQETDFKMFV